MPKISNPSFNRAVARIIDANINRAKEGLRVSEEITRFVLQDRRLTTNLKNIRHNFQTTSSKLMTAARLFEARDSRGDIGREIYAGELERRSCQDIFFANMQRVKESVRVLEEFAKLKNRKTALALKAIRYRIYTIEKTAAALISC